MSNRNLRRSVQMVETYFETGKKDLCRGHFRHVVGFFAEKHPKHQDALAKAAGVSALAIESAKAGNPTKMRDDQRVAAAKYICQVAAKQGVEIPANLAKRIGYEPASA